MKVEEIKVTTIRITEVQGLDPVTVHLHDDYPGAGFITVTCYGRSWSCYWAGMGRRNIEEFVAQCDASYLVNKLGFKQTRQEQEYLIRICTAVLNAIRLRVGALVPT